MPVTAQYAQKWYCRQPTPPSQNINNGVRRTTTCRLNIVEGGQKRQVVGGGGAPEGGAGWHGGHPLRYQVTAPYAQHNNRLVRTSRSPSPTLMPHITSRQHRLPRLSRSITLECSTVTVMPRLCVSSPALRHAHRLTCHATVSY